MAYADVIVRLQAAPASVDNIQQGVDRLAGAIQERKDQITALRAEYAGLQGDITALPDGEAKTNAQATFTALNAQLTAAEAVVDALLAV